MGRERPLDLTAEEVRDGGMDAVLRCSVGWTGDHRVVSSVAPVSSVNFQTNVWAQLEGAELIAFTETWKKYIEEPWRWIRVDG
jgi:2-oxoisovalerate dehydrogenase E2 component (dihydrolipoyl transacylase)